MFFFLHIRRNTIPLNTFGLGLKDICVNPCTPATLLMMPCAPLFKVVDYMNKGEYIAPFAIFGYTNTVEKKRLVIDPFSAEVVKRIFDYAVNGEKARQIAIRLNTEGIPTPNEYNRIKSTKKRHYVPMDTVPVWTGDIVRRILKDERYTGTMVCGKYTSIKRKMIPVPKSEWIITPGTHEAIVSADVFQKAQMILRTRAEIIRPDAPKSVLTGMIKCSCCKKSLAFESRYRRDFYCHNINLGMGCENSRIGEAVLIDTIFSAIKAKLAMIKVSEPSYVAEKQLKMVESGNSKQELEIKIKKLRRSQSAALEEYLEDKIDKGELQARKLKAAALILEAEEHLTALASQSDNPLELVEQHKPFYEQDTLTREMALALIKEVRISSATEVEIVWNFQEFYQEIEQGFMPKLAV